MKKSKRQEINHPYSNGCVLLSHCCPNCKYHRGLLIVRFDGDPGFVRCGKCDVALYSVAERQAGEVAA